MTRHTLSDLFNPEPDTWGSRGDPYLWAALRDHFSDTPMPTSHGELCGIITEAFEQLTGNRLGTAENFYLENFAHGGMSSGYICPEWWRNDALPFFKHALARIQQDDPAQSTRRTDK